MNKLGFKALTCLCLTIGIVSYFYFDYKYKIQLHHDTQKNIEAELEERKILSEKEDREKEHKKKKLLDCTNKVEKLFLETVRELMKKGVTEGFGKLVDIKFKELDHCFKLYPHPDQK